MNSGGLPDQLVSTIQYNTISHWLGSNPYFFDCKCRDIISMDYRLHLLNDFITLLLSRGKYWSLVDDKWLEREWLWKKLRSDDKTITMLRLSHAELVVVVSVWQERANVFLEIHGTCLFVYCVLLMSIVSNNILRNQDLSICSLSQLFKLFR